MKINFERKYSNRSYGFMIAGTIIMIAAAVVTGVIFSIITKTMHSVDRELTMEFDKHYAFIAEDSESDFWKEVFEAASAQSKDYNAYLEDIGTELGRDYSTEDLLRIAVNSHMPLDAALFGSASCSSRRPAFTKAMVSAWIESCVWVVPLLSVHWEKVSVPSTRMSRPLFRYSARRKWFSRLLRTLTHVVVFCPLM